MKQPLRAVITGASGGIGTNYARLLAARNTNLYLVARRKEQLKSLAAELRSKNGVEVEIHSLELCLPDASETLLRDASKDGKIVRKRNESLRSYNERQSPYSR